MDAANSIGCHIPMWKLFQSISYTDPPPEFVIVQDGWKEDEHDSILKKKDLISSFELANEWELRKKITNPYEAIFSTSDTNSFPSIAHVNPLSRSYFKMVEMLYVAEFWNTATTPLTTAHVCEGPGGFLQCIVEQAKERRMNIANAYAMTLKSTKSQIPGWKRSSKFLKKHPEIQLLYGPDMTGNILLKRNQDAFCETAKDAAIFTADGGFDFSMDYSKQEETAFSLVVASFSMALRTVRKGGIFIIKLFDIYSPVTVDLILGSAAFCTSFYIYKPATSRPCNSERYFIGLGYKGRREAREWIEHLEIAQRKHIEKPLTRLCDIPATSPYILAVKEQIAWQERLQTSSIEAAMFMKKEDIAGHVERAIKKSVEWCSTFGVPYGL